MKCATLAIIVFATSTAFGQHNDHSVANDSLNSKKRGSKDSLHFGGEIRKREYSAHAIEIFGSSIISKFGELNSFNSSINGGSRALELSSTAARSFALLPGVTVSSLGSAIEKPVVRGQSASRIVTLQDAAPTADFAGSGADHLIAANASLANRIELLRGPAALKYAGNTMVGALNVDRDIYAFDAPKNFSLNAQARYGEASDSKSLSSSASRALGPYGIKALMDYRKGGNLKTRAQVVPNTAFNASDATLGGSRTWENFRLGTAFNYSTNDYGVPGGVAGLHPNGADIEMRNYSGRIKSILHLHEPALDNIDFELSRSFYRHKEFESNGSLGAIFQRTDYRAAVNFNQISDDVIKNSTLGATAQTGRLRYGGYVLSPQTDYFLGALYFFQELEIDKTYIQYAARLGYDKFEPMDNSGASPKTFPTLAASLSAMREAADKLFLGITLSRSSRAPSAEELFNRGPHLASFTYNIGNPSLNEETAFGAEGFAFYRHDDAFVELRAYYFDYDSYILHSFTGDTNYAKLLPIYRTTNAEAVISGGELSGLFSITKQLELSGSMAYVHGKRNGREYLPMMPPLSGKLGVICTYKATKFELETAYALRQGNVDRFESHTPGYVLLNSAIGTSIVGDGYVHHFSARVENILNSKWRNHLSLLKNILPEPGINFFLTYSLFFEKG